MGENEKNTNDENRSNSDTNEQDRKNLQTLLDIANLTNQIVSSMQ